MLYIDIQYVLLTSKKLLLIFKLILDFFGQIIIAFESLSSNPVQIY